MKYCCHVQESFTTVQHCFVIRRECYSTTAVTTDVPTKMVNASTALIASTVIAGVSDATAIKLAEKLMEKGLLI